MLFDRVEKLYRTLIKCYHGELGPRMFIYRKTGYYTNYHLTLDNGQKLFYRLYKTMDEPNYISYCFECFDITNNEAVNIFEMLVISPDKYLDNFPFILKGYLLGAEKLNDYIKQFEDYVYSYANDNLSNNDNSLTGSDYKSVNKQIETAKLLNVM